MPKAALRTKSRKLRSLRLPGGRKGTHYKRKKTSVSRCAQCGRSLSGVPRRIQSKQHKLPASQRRPERMYGGQLCHNCLGDVLKNATRDS